MCDGCVWTINFQDFEVHLPHIKGLVDIVTLRALPETDVHVLELLGHPAPRTGADPILDDEARRDSAIARAADDTEVTQYEAERAELVRQITTVAGSAAAPVASATMPNTRARR